MKIIGISGLPRSGKDTLAELFIKNGFYGVSFGDIVREFARERHKDKLDPISVSNMTDTANWLRETKGPDFVLQEALRRFEEAQKTKEYKGIAMFSLRAPVEADFVLAHGGELIWVEASDEVRHERDKRARREGEVEVSLDEFKRQENLQWQPQPGIPEEVQMNVAYVKSKATKILENSEDSLEVFNQKAEKLLSELA